MSNHSVEDLELALSFGVDPDDGTPLTENRRTEIQETIGYIKGIDQAGSVGYTPTAAAEEPDLAAAVAAIQQQLAGLTQAGAPGTLPAGGLPASFADILKGIDPRDSDTALEMFQWLCDNGRLQNVGTLNGGGYLLHYQEPKGTSKAGYTPGGTKGGRMVDQAVDAARASGAKPVERGLCDKCYSVVKKQDDGTVVVDDDGESATCSAGGAHNFQG